MIYIKALLVAASVAVAIIFMVQNIQELAEPLRIRLNLFFVQFESTPFATYLVILLAFFVGLFTASLLGLAERFRMRKMIRQCNKEVKTLSKELDSLRNLPITSSPLASEPISEEPLAEQDHKPPEEPEQKMLPEQAQSTKNEAEEAAESEESDTQVTPAEKEALS